MTKFLGVYIDENITWKHHISTVCSKISKSIGVLYKAREILTKCNLKQLYFSFVHCYINYANIVWASTQKSKLECLYRHQKHAARLINFEHRYTHAMPLLKEMKALSVYQLNIYNNLCFMYRCKHNSCPSIFYGIFTIKPPNKYSLRDNRSLYEPFCRTNLNQFCITYRGPHLWNKIVLPNFHSVDDTSYSSFRYKLKEIIFLLENINQHF